MWLKAVWEVMLATTGHFLCPQEHFQLVKREEYGGNRIFLVCFFKKGGGDTLAAILGFEDENRQG